MNRVQAYILPVDLFCKKNLTELGLAADAKIGLITNQSACDSMGRSTLENLLSKKCSIVALLVAEHGLEGTVGAGRAIEHSRHAKHAIPIYSLYQKNSKEVPEDVMGMLDVIIFDIQDVGMRHFTYSATLLKVLQACAKHKKTLIVLDRPNPLGMLVEGPVAQPVSFLSSVPVALRHGMTVGELALYCNTFVLDQKSRLWVVPLYDYKRTDQWRTLFKPLSPNITTLQAAKGYSFLGLLGEIKPFDVGIGTEKTFQRIGLPETLLSNCAWQEIAELLIRNGILSKNVSYTRRGIAHKGARSYLLVIAIRLNHLIHCCRYLRFVNEKKCCFRYQRTLMQPQDLHS